MKIRPILERDMEDLARLYEQFWNEESSVRKMKELFKKLEGDENYIFLACEIDGSVAGSVSGVVCQELYGDCRPFMVIENFIVDEEFRRQGIGTTLMSEIEKHASERECSHIHLITETDRLESRRFYESIGFDSDAHQGFKKKV